MHFFGVPLVCLQSFRLLGFMVLELGRRRTDTHTNRQAGRQRWPDPTTLYFFPESRKFQNIKKKKKIKIK